MNSPDAQHTPLSTPGLGTLLVRGLILGLLVGFLVNLAFSYTMPLLDKTQFLLIVQPISNLQDVFDTIRRAAEFLVAGMILSIFPAFLIIPAGILAGGLNGALFHWIGFHPVFRNLSGAIIGLGTGLFLAWPYVDILISPPNYSKEDTVMLLAALILGTLGGVLHSQMLVRWR